MKKALIIIILVLVLVAAGVYFFVYNKPHRDILSEKAAYSLHATELYNAFTTNADEANTQYLNQVISVTGTVSEISNINDNEVKVVLSDDENDIFGVACSFSDKEAETARSLPEGSQVTIKGLCTGYSGDDMMPGDVVLVKCSIENN